MTREKASVAEFIPPSVSLLEGRSTTAEGYQGCPTWGQRQQYTRAWRLAITTGPAEYRGSVSNPRIRWRGWRRRAGRPELSHARRLPDAVWHRFGAQRGHRVGHSAPPAAGPGRVHALRGGDLGHPWRVRFRCRARRHRSRAGLIPAVENRGEGLFLWLRGDAGEAGLRRDRGARAPRRTRARRRPVGAAAAARAAVPGRLVRPATHAVTPC